MLDQAKEIHKLDWDFLIVLDACRYDYFRSVYKAYLDGDLKLAISRGNHTSTWLKNTFTKRFNIPYFSGSPFVNSYGIGPFDARKFFEKIFNLYNTCFDSRISTVNPDCVKFFVKLKQPKSGIIHFMQPHGPWIGETKLSLPQVQVKFNPIEWTEVKIFNRVKPSVEYLRRAYRDNLRLVLSVVKDLLESLSGKIIVTSDHGELLGEDNLFFHDFINHPLIFQVPWLEINL